MSRIGQADEAGMTEKWLRDGSCNLEQPGRNASYGLATRLRRAKTSSQGWYVEVAQAAASNNPQVAETSSLDHGTATARMSCQVCTSVVGYGHASAKFPDCKLQLDHVSVK